jgi:hypothetical protein
MKTKGSAYGSRNPISLFCKTARFRPKLAAISALSALPKCALRMIRAELRSSSVRFCPKKISCCQDARQNHNFVRARPSHCVHRSGGVGMASRSCPGQQSFFPSRNLSVLPRLARSALSRRARACRSFGKPNRPFETGIPNPEGPFSWPFFLKHGPLFVVIENAREILVPTKRG